MSAYEKEKAKILKYSDEELWEYKKSTTPAARVQDLTEFSTWEMSFDQIEPDNPERKQQIAHFLAVSAYLDPSQISDFLFDIYRRETRNPALWLTIFSPPSELSDQSESDSVASDSVQPAVWSAEQFWRVIKHLYRLSLVQNIHSHPRMSFPIHPLVCDWLQLREKSKERDMLWEESTTLLSVVADSGWQVLSADQRQELLGHLGTCLEYSKRIRPQNGFGTRHMRNKTESFGLFFGTHERYTTSHDLFFSLYKDDHEQKGVESPETLNSMADLANVYLLQGRWKNRRSSHPSGAGQ